MPWRARSGLRRRGGFLLSRTSITHVEMFQVGEAVEDALESKDADVVVLNLQLSQAWQLLGDDSGGGVVQLAADCIVPYVHSMSVVMLVVGVKVLLRSSAVRGVVSASGNSYRCADH